MSSNADSFITTVLEAVRRDVLALLPSFRWGTVTSVNPVKVTVDGPDTTTLTPDVTVGGVYTGDRVFLLFWARRVTILGRSRGDDFENAPLLTGDYSNIEAWRALPSGRYRAWSGSATGVPHTYGFVEVRRYGADGQVTFYVQNTGRVLHMAWNASTTAVNWLDVGHARGQRIGASENLNNYVDHGVYFQDNNAQAAGGTNYPFPYAGCLEVFSVWDKNTAPGGFIYQRYTAYTSYGHRSAHRGRYNGSWGAWHEEMTHQGGDIEGLNVLQLGGTTAEPSYNLRRQVGSRMNRARWYLTGSETNPQPALWIEQEGIGSSAVLRVTSDGSISMTTMDNSPTPNAVRPLPFATATGKVTITPSAANAPTSMTVTLPAGRFTDIPSLQATAHTSLPERVSVGVNNPSTSSFQVVITRTDTTATGVFWTATQTEL